VYAKVFEACSFFELPRGGEARDPVDARTANVIVISPLE
jgi:hypothetical protein